MENTGNGIISGRSSSWHQTNSVKAVNAIQDAHYPWYVSATSNTHARLSSLTTYKTDMSQLQL